MIYLNYYFSVIIWQLFNPVGLYQSFLQNFGQFISILRSLFRESEFAYSPMSLPFNGNWKVFNGGVDKLHSHSWNIISQRFAYDFVLPEDANYKSDVKRRTVNDYLTFNEDVYSPNDGIVIKVKSDVRDNKYAGSGRIDVLTKDMRGNFVIIKHDADIYSLIAHLKMNSCLVKEGDAVRRGQIIAKCGNSGHSTQPHIHFQIQDGANWYFSRGLPIIFSDIQINNKSTNEFITKEQTFISRNDVITNVKNGRVSRKKVHVELKISDDLIIPLIQSLINTVAIIVGGGFIYYVIIRTILRIVSL